MKLRHLLCRFLLPAALAVGFTAAPAVRADIAPFPRPQPTPPPPPDPQPDPDTDDDESSMRVVVGAVTASVGVTLLGVWVIRRQLRRNVSNTSAATT